MRRNLTLFIPMTIERTSDGIVLIRGEPVGDLCSGLSFRKPDTPTDLHDLERMVRTHPELGVWVIFPQTPPTKSVQDWILRRPHKRLTVGTNAQLQSSAWLTPAIDWLELQPLNNDIAKGCKSWHLVEHLIIRIRQPKSSTATGELLARLPRMPKLSYLEMENFPVDTLEYLPEAPQISYVCCIGAATEMNADGVRFLCALPQLRSLRLSCCSWGNHPGLVLDETVDFEDCEPLW